MHKLPINFPFSVRISYMEKIDHLYLHPTRREILDQLDTSMQTGELCVKPGHRASTSDFFSKLVICEFYDLFRKFEEMRIPIVTRHPPISGESPLRYAARLGFLALQVARTGTEDDISFERMRRAGHAVLEFNIWRFVQLPTVRNFTYADGARCSGHAWMFVAPQDAKNWVVTETIDHKRPGLEKANFYSWPTIMGLNQVSGDRADIEFMKNMHQTMLDCRDAGIPHPFATVDKTELFDMHTDCGLPPEYFTVDKGVMWVVSMFLGVVD